MTTMVGHAIDNRGAQRSPFAEPALGSALRVAPLLGKIIDIVFGFIDRFDIRAVIFFNAALFIASYAILLALLRQYLRNALTPIPVLVAGVTWFSLADVQTLFGRFRARGT